jgi:uncharacterized protein
MTTPSESKPGLILRVLRFPPIRLVLLTALLFYMYISGHMFRGAFAHGAIPDLAVTLWTIVLTMALYVGFVNTVEGRPATEVSRAGMGRELGIGMLLGAGLYTLCVLVLTMLGIYRFDGLNGGQVLLAAAWFGLSSGFFEELFFRGVLFRIVTEVFGSWIGLAVSSLAFGLVHLNNPGSTLQGALFIAMEAGVLLAAAYMLTGRLWMSMGWHAAWNYTQSAVFSGITSGNEPSKGLVKAIIDGPQMLTGGSFGMEASVVALLLCTATGVILLAMAVKRGKIEPPMWRRPS